jgi:dephospho-CoA kinase
MCENMLVVGLTGGIASGKSTVSRLFVEAGVPVICADELAREAVKAGSPGLAEIRRAFGDEVIDPQGELDRAAMARVVFHQADRRELLESIIHPRVAEGKRKRLTELQRQGYSLAIVDVPLLYETGWDQFFDLVIVVTVSRETQEERLRARDGMSREEARARLDAQMPIEEKAKRAHRVVDNSGSVERTREQVDVLVTELTSMAQRKAMGNPVGSS